MAVPPPASPDPVAAPTDRADPAPSAGIVAVTGPTGFIGSRVVPALLARGRAVHALSRRPGGEHDGPDGVALVHGDLGDPDALAQLVDGAAHVVHAASYVGPDEAAARSVNVDGTRALVDAATAVRARVLYVSTASVSGSGPHRGAPREGSAPESPASRTRLEAERIVLDAGGAVVRPHIVYGEGDRWVFPGALRLVSAVGAVPATTALVSVVHVTDLGERIAAGVGRAGVVPVHEDAPVEAIGMVAAALDAFGRPLPEVVPVAVFRERAAGLGLGPHQLSLLLDDSWFDRDEPGEPGAVTLTAADRRWYASLAASA